MRRGTCISKCFVSTFWLEYPLFYRYTDHAAYTFRPVSEKMPTILFLKDAANNRFSCFKGIQVLISSTGNLLKLHNHRRLCSEFVSFTLQAVIDSPRYPISRKDGEFRICLSCWKPFAFAESSPSASSVCQRDSV